MSNADIIEISSEVPDAEQIVDRIDSLVREKMEQGAYDDARIGLAERSNLIHLEDRDDYLKFYLRCLHSGAFVDINDWEIGDKREGISGKLLIKMKSVIWKLLKFYTFRMWSQQNQINGLTATAIESTFLRYEQRINELEARVKELEKAPAGETPTT